MSVKVQLRRDVAANVAAFTGAQGEVIVDTTNNRLVVQDGATAGGFAAAKLSEVITARRSAVADANYAVLTTDRIVAYSSLTAARTVTLPAASAFPVGVQLLIVDESGACSATNAISISRAGADTIGGAASTVLNGAYMSVALESNGANAWTYAASPPNEEFALLGVGTAPDPNNPLSVYANTALFNAAAGGVSAGNMRLVVNKASAANTASYLFQDGFSGRAEVGLTGDDHFHVKTSPDGSVWREFINVDPSTGLVSFPSGVGSGSLAGFRNRLRNASFAINQRGVSGAVTLAAGVYGHDGVKAGAAGCTYTFATSGLDTTLTITAGSLILPIEAALIEGGVYAVSNAGTAQARVWQGTGYTGSGAYASAPFTTASLAANTQTNVEFSTGSALRPQFEPGAYATSFERRGPAFETAFCQRYLFATTLAGVFGSVYSASAIVFGVQFPVQMAATPTVSTPVASVAPPTATYSIYAMGTGYLSASGLHSLTGFPVSPNGALLALGSFSGLSVGQTAFMAASAAAAMFSAEL